MLTSEELSALRAAVPGDPDLTRLLETLRARARPVLETFPVVPQVKALLSRDGGSCPEDGATLGFDPWSPPPGRHVCPRCGAAFSGERHHRHWARAQHLWLAERAAELSLIAAVGEDTTAAAARAAELLAAYDELYFRLPNRDNVLGPSHLFFSTYLESLWITSYLAAACLLRESGFLDPERVSGIDRVAEEAATLIGEFNEGFSNRQTWHSAALTAIAVWFNDEELARTAVESRTGLLGHLADGFAEDGLWWEGENYHLFALRGLMQGLHWARAMGFDLLDDPEVRQHFRAALLGPTRSALPDFTYPARRDSRYGVSLAQPASLELWEIGRAWLGGDAELEAWLAALYALPKPSRPEDAYDAWLHDAGRPAPARYTRSDLSWWGLTALTAPPPLRPSAPLTSVLLANQGLAVLRTLPHRPSAPPPLCYASLECGPEIGGHGHPDRLHLTLHANGVHWLPDPGTGSYVHESLAWYRSALAHNAPLLDGSNAGGDAWCEAFESANGWSWCRGKAGEVRRALVLGPAHLVDLLEVDAAEPRDVVLPWHFHGELQTESAGGWEPTPVEHPFVSGAERFVPAPEAPGCTVISVHHEGHRLTAHLHAPEAELIRAVAPGLPIEPEPRPFLFLRARSAALRWVSVLDFATTEDDAVTGVELSGEAITVASRVGTIRYRFTPTGLQVEHDGGSQALAGLRRAPRPRPRPDPTASDAEALAPRITSPPALDGTLEGFALSAPLSLDTELQYRRSEEPYDPERLAAQAWVNWDGDALYLAVEVSKPDLVFRGPDATPLELDNEPEDIHSDGLQLYLGHGGEAWGFLVVPQDKGMVHTRSIGEPTGATVSGSWATTEAGYLVTLRLDHPGIVHLGPGARLRFDLLINEMQPDRQRRAGQLIWSGGNGWIYLRGDRHELSQAGTLELG